MSRQSLVLTFDVEDWHQLVHRRLGLVDWDQARPALPRQVDSILDRLDGLGVRATFFLLGLTVRRYPVLAAEIAARGHEIACHGDAHRPVHTQTAAEFRDDLQTALETIERATGRVATGYRAPLFSINRNTPWAYDVLADLGFRYDASQYDSARVPNRIQGIPGEPYILELASGRTLWEFPVAVSRVGGITLPVGGGSYWRLLPERTLFRSLRAAATDDRLPTIYFHPYEWDPDALHIVLPKGASLGQRALAAERTLWRAAGRARVPRLVQAAAREFRLQTCEQAYARLDDVGACRRSLSEEGRLL
jgi:polysaccharide deacetylase family protein (PEP-CTERM system associated)